ncbi:MAG: hypothetical protein EXR69_10935 [Myxococcales bacterium]|nr:hypothetical protein [Myxococcales bacterium]
MYRCFIACFLVVCVGLAGVPSVARADPLAFRLPSAGGVAAVGWGEVSAAYWQGSRLGFGVDATLPGEVSLAVGLRGRTGKGMGLDFGVAGGPRVHFTAGELPRFGLMAAPWCAFALRGRGVLNLGATLPGDVDLNAFGASWSAPLLLDASTGWTFGTVRLGLWGNIGASYIVVSGSLREWVPQGNAGLWLGIGKENRAR